MAELADALDSGSSEGNFMQVQVLLPAPKKHLLYVGAFVLLNSFSAVNKDVLASNVASFIATK